MSYFGIRDQDDKLICVVTEASHIEEAKNIFKNNNLKICEVSIEDLDIFIKEWQDGKSAGTKLLGRNIVNERGL